MEYKRPQFAEVLERMNEPRKFIQVLAGPRQVGKSTLINQVLEECTLPHYLYNADGVDENDTDWIRRVWESARIQMDTRQQTEAILVIDEIQKIKRWSEIVKREWDADTRNRRQLKLFLLGSSRLMLRKGLTESLAGRFELIRLGHWTLQEMEDAFGLTLDEWIYYGGYPGSASLIKDMRRWRKYIKESLVAPAIEKDIIMTSNIYKPALMKQLFELGCSYSAELLSLTKALGQLQDAGNVTTLSSYLNILNQCNLLAGLQKYANDDARRYQSVPKFQVYNNALLTAYRGTTYDKDRIDPQIWGRWVESAVGGYLLGDAEDGGYKVYYWRERSDEVDYIVASQGTAIALEVKSGRRGMNSGLPKFCENFHPRRALVIGTDGIPFKEFFHMKIEDLL
ncbi:ATP-binding protein [Xylanibacter ruminicola]|uniref:ATP-binding protein n=1 Tax=Xylanibacter ruminicola TaxID=839 RepID=UPI00048CE27F|nr:AAA family ATPase [Xylanibacter ruminicola]